MRKPVFRFAVDLDDYRNDRDLYYGIDEYPYTLAKNNNQLQRDILNFEKKLDAFFVRVGAIFNKRASKDCADLIFDYYKCNMNKEVFIKKHQKDFK